MITPSEWGRFTIKYISSWKMLNDMPASKLGYIQFVNNIFFILNPLMLNILHNLPSKEP